MEQEEKKLPEGLEEAAERWAEKHPFNGRVSSFKAGAEWDRAKMLEGAGEMVCFADWYDGPYLNFTSEQMIDAIEKAGAKEGDTVRVIIVKKVAE